MIDPADQQTQQLPLETKRRPGRPSTGKAKSRAEIQRAYRERNKGNVTSNASGQIKSLEEQLARAKAEIKELQIALGKEVATRKKAEAALLPITKNSNESHEKWVVQIKTTARSHWKTITPKGQELPTQAAAEAAILDAPPNKKTARYSVKKIEAAHNGRYG